MPPKLFIIILLHLEIISRGDDNMPKDSQVDKKGVREAKANFDTPSTRETGKNKNRTIKKQST